MEMSAFGGKAAVPQIRLSGSQRPKADIDGVRPIRDLQRCPIKNAGNAIGYAESAIVCCRSHATGRGGLIFRAVGRASFGGSHDHDESARRMESNQATLRHWCAYGLKFRIERAQRPNFAGHWRLAGQRTPSTYRHVLDPQYILIAPGRSLHLHIERG